MTPEAWRSSDDPRELLCFAGPRIPREHLALALADLAEATVYYWYVRYPLDWRLAWGVATLRAWCFGHATNDELKRARDQVLAARVLPMTDGHADQAARAAATCVAACTTAPLCRTLTPVAAPKDLDSTPLPELLARAAHFAALAAQHGFDGEASAYEATHRGLAGLMRRLIAFPARPNEEWQATPGLAFSGDAMLRLDGRKIGDVVPRDEFAGLSAERAVAFDAAQQLADPERPLPSAYRDPPAPKPKLTGCVMTPILVDGVQVGTRISCYGHPEEEPAPAPAKRAAPVPRKRVVHATGSLSEQELRARTVATAAGLVRERVSVTGSGVRFVLDKAHLDTPGHIRRREDSLRRDRRELAERPSEQVRARLVGKQERLAALRPVPVRVEALLAVFVLSPLLLGFAFVISYRVSHTVAWHALARGTPSKVPLWVAGFTKRPGVT